MPSEGVSDGIFCAGRQHREIPHYIDVITKYSGLTKIRTRWINKNQDKATRAATVQIVRQGEATPYWFYLIHYIIPYADWF
ncbi:hypothetical protein [Neisseria meningitidis]|uniref:hypothetical protein n=1 Tax=Neisseria meningitidis TaxID=487 RepID=UPI0009AB3373